MRTGLAPFLFCLLSFVASLPAGAQLTFTLGWELDPGASSFGVALGDVDLDGDLDIYIADLDGPDRLWLNDGSGTFTDSGQVLEAGRSTFPILAPLDGDLFPDLWLARLLSTSATYLNDGTGLLTFDQSYGASTSRRGAALGDLDGDGDLDAFAVTDTSTTASEVLLNEGLGVFTDTGQALGLTFSRSAALGDVDGDLDLDALVGNNGGNALWLNAGAGTFTDSGLSFGGTGTFGVAMADLNGDTFLDAIFANGQSFPDPNQVWFGDGSGGFTDSGQDLGSEYSFAVALADFNGDGSLDAFFGNNASLENRLFANDGSGGFTEVTAFDFGIGAALGVATGDLTGNGRPDIVIANGSNPDQIFFNGGPGNGFVESPQMLGSSRGSCVALGDLDDDGDLDAAIGAGTIARILVNDGTGHFVDSRQWLGHGLGDGVTDLEFFDADGDGDLDLYVAINSSGLFGDGNNQVWLNDGNGVFDQTTEILIGEVSTPEAAVGDIDDDGDIDLVNGNFTENRVWRGDGAGGFTMDPVVVGEGNSQAVVLGDLDGDLDLDIIFGNNGEGNEVWLNDGAGNFTDSLQSLGTNSTIALALGDVDGDGDLDLWEGNTSQNDALWLNDGTGTFTDSGSSFGFSERTTTAHLVDFDFDGDLDCYTTYGGGSEQANKLWLGDGAGGFVDSGLDFGRDSSNFSAVGDLDGNATPDLLIINFLGDHRVWLNDSQSPTIFADGFESGDESAWSSTVP